MKILEIKCQLWINFECFGDKIEVDLDKEKDDGASESEMIMEGEVGVRRVATLIN